MTDDLREPATEALARCWNRLDPGLLEPWLADDVRYASVDTELHLDGKVAVLDHLVRKVELIEQVGGDARLIAELGTVDVAGEPRRPCVIASQGHRGPTALFLVRVDDLGRIAAIEVTTSDPVPARAVGSGVVPD